MTKLTQNFSKSEVTDWANNVRNMTPADRALAIEVSRQRMTPEIMVKALEIARVLQLIRDVTNATMNVDGKASVTVTSWFRTVQWEHHRKRTGTSQHIHGHAVDFYFSGVSDKDNQRLLRTWYNIMNANWQGGLAKMERNGVIAFIHLDCREKRARWSY